MDTRWVQLLIPLLLLSDWYLLVNSSKELRGRRLIIWLKSDIFVMAGCYFVLQNKNTTQVVYQPAFFNFKNLFWTDVKCAYRFIWTQFTF